MSGKDAKAGGIAVLLLLLALSALFMARPPGAGGYPGPGTGYGGWTAEAALDLANPRHVQMAAGGGKLYLVADDGADTWFYRATDPGTLNWTRVRQMDYNPPWTARDAYLDARGDDVVVSWKEHANGKWALFLATSRDGGLTWRYWWDSQAGWDNYEAHVYLHGDYVHLAYVSNYPGRDEVYYRRFNLDLNSSTLSCVSDAGDGVAAGDPCVEACGDDNVSVYYVRRSGPPNPVWQAWTDDGGSRWHPNEIISTQGWGDCSHPEVTAWWDGAERRVMVVASVRDLRNGGDCVYCFRYYSNLWEKDMLLAGNAAWTSYPQLCSRGAQLFAVYRQSGGSAGHEGVGKINTHTGEKGSWYPVDDLFFENMPYDNPGCMDCCSDGQYFYAAAAGTGSRAVVLTKREDARDPSVTMENPGYYHRADFPVRATAADDFDRTCDWLLAPQCERYDRGILHADFHYRPANSQAWSEWPGGGRDADAPWEMTFPGGSIAEGFYDFRVTVTDTAQRVSENVLGGVCVDRTPPVAALEIPPPDGREGWYVNRPAPGVKVTGTDALSGVARALYRFDDQLSWTVYSEPFPLPEGEHVIHYYAEDRAGNASAAESFSYRADFTDPTGSIFSPPPGGYYRSTMQAEVSCSDAGSGVAGVTWLVDGSEQAATAENRAVLDLSGLPDGQHVLEAVIEDASGRSFRTPPVLFYKDVTPPAARIVEPMGIDWVRGMVAVRAELRDNLKEGGATFFVDGKPIGDCASPPWAVSWDTSTVKNGFHTLRVEAWDAAGNRSSAGASGEVLVFVGNNISQTNHFAEGCTREGFDTWLCLQNPGDQAAAVTVNYYLGEGQGAASTRTYYVPACSRTTIFVNGEVGAGRDVSIQVTSNRPIVSERPIYFTYRGSGGRELRGGHTGQGAHFPRGEWYFAEGCTREGFDTWLCLQNPGSREAVVRVEYMMEGGAYQERTYRVGPWSRDTVSVNREVGPGHDVSMRVTSDVPVVAERPVYFLYQGMWDGGHNVIGAVRPEREWYLAEGCTRTGFNQWICLMNPGEEPTTAHLVYVMEDGGLIERRYPLAPHSRFTVNVNNDVARQHDVSTIVTSERPIVVERPMYFLYRSAIDEGSNTMGVNKPGSSWYLAEGCTRTGFEEWICIMNPGEGPAQAELRFILEDGFLRRHTVTVPAKTRVSVRVNDVVGTGHDVSCEVMSDRPVVVERPIYAVYRGSCPAGDTLSGYTFNP